MRYVTRLPAIVPKGITGPEWCNRLRTQDILVTDDVALDMCTGHFKLSPKGESVQPVLLDGRLFSDSERTLRRVKEAALHGELTGGKKLVPPCADLICYVREILSDEEMPNRGIVRILSPHLPIVRMGAASQIIMGNGFVHSLYDADGYVWEDYYSFLFIEA